MLSKSIKLSWENVFNTNHKWYGHLDLARRMATHSGYPYFCWNDCIYDTETGSGTGFTVETMKNAEY